MIFQLNFHSLTLNFVPTTFDRGVNGKDGSGGRSCGDIFAFWTSDDNLCRLHSVQIQRIQLLLLLQNQVLAEKKQKTEKCVSFYMKM